VCPSSGVKRGLCHPLLQACHPYKEKSLKMFNSVNFSIVSEARKAEVTYVEK